MGGNNGWYQWGEYSTGSGDFWPIVGLLLLAFFLWAAWE